MMKCKWYLPLIAISLVVLIISTAGCITIVRQGPAAPASTTEGPTARPTINSFTTSPANISQGQRTTLSWDVSGATGIAIQPEIGTVGSSGSLLLSPPATITYTLTATNQAGSATSSVTLTVTPVAVGKPDLVITDIWLTGSVVNYKIANRGNADAEPSQSYFYVNNLKQATDWVDSLAAGAERTTSFSNFNWNIQSGPAAGPYGGGLTTHYVKVCADINNEVEESDKGNNCLTKIWGETFTYDFVKNAHLAKWRSGAGDLRWPMVPSDTKGAAYVLNDTVVMCPERVSNGWIQGRFADFYTPFLGALTTSREIVIPEMAKFTAKVGFEQGKVSADGVRVALGYLDATSSLVLFPKMDLYPGETSRVYEIDLSTLAGKKTEFILWVEAKDSPEGDYVRWVGPKIVQE